ncbi:MAG: SDR family oxidoreductase [Chloroflexota bacterium]|nr:MAG: SDR family oxidoreductase [Chloroflexota bacterium]
MRVAITGVSGYLGTRLLAYLDQRPEIETIIGMSRTRPSYDSKKLSFHSMDINGPIGDVLAGHQVDALVHLAWVFEPTHDEEAARRVNVGGTRNVLRVCDELGIKKIVYAGSTTAYGAHPDNPVPLTEDRPVRGNPLFQYSRDKAAVDAILREYQGSHSDACLSITRVCIVVGPNTDNYLARYMSRPVVFTVRGYDPPLQFLQEDDFVAVMTKLVMHDFPGVYNLAGDGTVQLSELGRLFGARVVPLPYRVIHPLMAAFWALRVKAVVEAPPSLLDFIRFPWVADCSKAKRELGFQPRYTSQEALLSYIEAHRSSR